MTAPTPKGKVQPLKNDKEAHTIDNELSEIRSENLLVDSPQPRDEEKAVSSSPVEFIDKDIRDEDTQMIEDKIVDEDTDLSERSSRQTEKRARKPSFKQHIATRPTLSHAGIHSTQTPPSSTYNPSK